MGANFAVYHRPSISAPSANLNQQSPCWELPCKYSTTWAGTKSEPLLNSRDALNIISIYAHCSGSATAWTKNSLYARANLLY